MCVNLMYNRGGIINYGERMEDPVNGTKKLAFLGMKDRSLMQVD